MKYDFSRLTAQEITELDRLLAADDRGEHLTVAEHRILDSLFARAALGTRALDSVQDGNESDEEEAPEPLDLLKDHFGAAGEADEVLSSSAASGRGSENFLRGREQKRLGWWVLEIGLSEAARRCQVTEAAIQRAAEGKWLRPETSRAIRATVPLSVKAPAPRKKYGCVLTDAERETLAKVCYPKRGTFFGRGVGLNTAEISNAKNGWAVSDRVITQLRPALAATARLLQGLEGGDEQALTDAALAARELGLAPVLSDFLRDQIREDLVAGRGAHATRAQLALAVLAQGQAGADRRAAKNKAQEGR